MARIMEKKGGALGWVRTQEKEEECILDGPVGG